MVFKIQHNDLNVSIRLDKNKECCSLNYADKRALSLTSFLSSQTVIHRTSNLKFICCKILCAVRMLIFFVYLFSHLKRDG